MRARAIEELGLQKLQQQRPSLSRSTRLKRRTLIAVEAMSSLRKFHIHILLACGLERARDGAALLWRNVLIELSPEEEHGRMQRCGFVEQSGNPAAIIGSRGAQRKRGIGQE